MVLSITIFMRFVHFKEFLTSFQASIKDHAINAKYNTLFFEKIV